VPNTMKEMTKLGYKIICVGIIVAIVWIHGILPTRGLNVTGPLAILDSTFTLLLLLEVLLLAYVIGLKCLNKIAHLEITKFEILIFSLTIGMGILAYGVFFLALVGWLKLIAISLLIIIAISWTWRELKETIEQIPILIREIPGCWKKISNGSRWLILCAGVILGMVFLQALTPVWDYDGLMYHLQAPRLFLEAGRIYLLPEIWQANGPLTTEMLFTLGLAFGSDTFAKLIHLTYFGIMLLGTYSFCCHFLSTRHGQIATAILLGIPILPLWASWAYTDIAWAVLEFLAVYAIFSWSKGARRKWLFLAGVMSGMALGNKYLALGGTALISLWILWQSRKQSWKQIFSNLCLYLIPAIIIALPWYAKNMILTNNPIYPFYFGGQGWDQSRLNILMTYIKSFGASQTWGDNILLPFRMYLEKFTFSTYSIEVPSIIFLLAFLYPWKNGKCGLGGLAVFTALWFVIWSLGSRQVRFLLPIFPSLAIISGTVLLNLFRNSSADSANKKANNNLKIRFNRIMITGLTCGVILSTIIYQLENIIVLKPYRVVFGFETKDAFLSRALYDYPAIKFTQTNLKPNDRVLMLWDGRSYYCNKMCLADVDQSAWYHLFVESNDPYVIGNYLNASGVTHIYFGEAELAWLIRYHDPSGIQKQSATFFLEVFRDACTREIYHDRYGVIYELTCHD